MNFNFEHAFSDVISKVKGVVLNYTEYQRKVDEATNNDPWGTSSTLMTDIAKATHHYQHFNEIVEMIYKKMGERGSNWRQCYKALQLLEYLIKNGSERIVAYAQDHQYDIKALKNFHHIDEKGKDQGLNVRNRAEEIVALLASDDRIREERRKAKENRGKYGGVSSDTYSSNSSFGGTGRYGGFGSDSYTRRYDEEPSSTTNYSSNGIKEASQPKTVEKASPVKQVNLIDMSAADEPVPVAPKASAVEEEDDWGDFSSAPTHTAPSQTTTPFAGLNFTPQKPAVSTPINLSQTPSQTAAPSLFPSQHQQPVLSLNQQQVIQPQVQKDPFGDLLSLAATPQKPVAQSFASPSTNPPPAAKANNNDLLDLLG